MFIANKNPDMTEINLKILFFITNTLHKCKNTIKIPNFALM